MILSNEEKDEIQRIVEEVPYEELLTFKNKMISEAEFIQNQLRKLWYYNNNPLANPIEANHHRDLESQLHVCNEYLVFIDGRIEGKNSWFFRSTRRLKWANRFRWNR